MSDKPTFIGWLMEQENARTMPNPLGTPPSWVYDMMNDFSEIESTFARTFYPDLRPLDRLKRGNQRLKSLGMPKVVNIDQLTPIEPELDPKHVQALVNKTGGELPWVYLYQGKMVINDGNHRVAAAKLRGDTTVKVNLVDLNNVKTMLDLMNAQ